MRLWCSVVLLGRYSFTAIPPKVTSYSARSLREDEVILRVYEVIFGGIAEKGSIGSAIINYSGRVEHLSLWQ